ncbi:helix-hairpin-helix domain-containing protein [Deinococcus radiomollis]|uniref:ComEA family DNA-binding protein n=1 Tax=Deinococcus radiomollis TaxID=468916 RepID=UPI003891FE49
MKYVLTFLSLLTLTAGAVSAQTRTTTPAKPVATSHATVNINTATAQQLMTLPGIGPKTSAQIIKYRPFKNKADVLAKLSRIGPMEWAKIESQVRF